MHMTSIINRQNKLIKECQDSNKSLGDFMNHLMSTRFNAD